MAVVKMHQAKSQLSKLIARAEAGEEIVLARGDKPVAKIVPVVDEVRQPRKPGALKGMFTLPDGFFDPLPEEELRAWEGEHSFDPNKDKTVGGEPEADASKKAASEKAE